MIDGTTLRPECPFFGCRNGSTKPCHTFRHSHSHYSHIVDCSIAVALHSNDRTRRLLRSIARRKLQLDPYEAIRYCNTMNLRSRRYTRECDDSVRYMVRIHQRRLPLPPTAYSKPTHRPPPKWRIMHQSDARAFAPFILLSRQKALSTKAPTECSRDSNLFVFIRKFLILRQEHPRATPHHGNRRQKAHCFAKNVTTESLLATELLHLSNVVHQ